MSTGAATVSPRFRPGPVPVLVFALINVLALWRVGRFEPPAEASIPVGKVEAGRAAFSDLGCNACHDLGEERRIGPGLGGILGEPRRFEDGSTGVVDEAYLRESLRTPQARVREGYPPSMPDYGDLMDDATLDALVEYIGSL